MAVYAKGDKFMASFGAGASRVRKTFSTEAAALLWETQQDTAREAVKAIAVPAVTGWTLQKCFDQAHRRNWKGNGGEKASVINATSALTFFGPDTPASAITPNDIREYMEDLEDTHGNSGSTRNRKLSALNMMLKEAIEYGGLEKLPRTMRAKETKHRVVWFTDAEEVDMLKMADHMGRPELQDFIAIGFDTGFRRMEILGLTVDDCVGGMVLLHEGQTKTDNARSVPDTPRIREIVAKRKLAGDHRLFPTLTVSGLRKQWDDLRALLGRADDAGFIPHVMRHTCATRLVTSGVPLTAVQAWMGHSDVQTTMRYAHVVGGQLLAARERLEARNKDLLVGL